MKTKISVIFILLLVIFSEGCIGQSSNAQDVGENCTAILDGQHISTITIQPKEKLYYIDGCGSEEFCNSNDRVGKRVAEFAKHTT